MNIMEGIAILSTSECVVTPNWVSIIMIIGMIIMFSSLVIAVKSYSNYFNIVLCVIGIAINASISYWVIFWIYTVAESIVILCRFLYNLIKD